MSTELQKVEPMPLGAVARPERFDIEALFRLAIDKPETVERLMAVRRELNAENAKRAFDEAMSAFQAECPVIKKEKAVPDRSGNTAYKYSPIEQIEVVIRPFCQKHGFSHTFDTDTASAQGWVIAKCIVKHREGHECISTGKFPLGTKTGIMSDTQVYAAALTFANRRSLCNAYGLVLAGEDMDGRSGKVKPEGPSAMRPEKSALAPLVQELWTVLKPVRGEKQSWDEANRWMWEQEILDGAIPEAAPDLKEARFREVINKVKERLKA